MTEQPRPEEIGTDDRVVAVLERTLATYAGQAPSVAGLPERVRRTRRRRTLIQTGVGTGAALAVAAAVVVPLVLGGGGSVNSVVQMSDPGWRWESYRGLELEVPTGWGYGTSQQPWCLAGDDGSAVTAYVGRPGVTPMIGCDGEIAPVDQRVSFVWFGISAFQAADLGDGWRVESPMVGSEGFTLMTNDPAIRDHIIESARLVDSDGADANGCDVMHPIAKDPDVRPEPSGALPAPAEITGASMCQYTLSMVDTITDGASLLGSRRLTAAAAATLLEAVVSAPEVGARPPEAACSYSPVYGSDVVLVRFDAGDVIREVVVRPNGCALGTDDGVTERELTDRVRGLVLDGPIVDGAGLSAW